MSATRADRLVSRRAITFRLARDGCLDVDGNPIHINSVGATIDLRCSNGFLAATAGLRIDHLLLSPSLAGRLVAAGVDRDVRARERSSDHRAGLGSNLRTQIPDQHGRRSAGGKLDRADAPFIEVAKVGGRDPVFSAQYTCGPGRFPYRELTPPTRLTQRGGTEWPAAIRPGKSPISNRSRRDSRATRSSIGTRASWPMTNSRSLSIAAKSVRA
jgi:hypothetical protein